MPKDGSDVEFASLCFGFLFCFVGFSSKKECCFFFGGGWVFVSHIFHHFMDILITNKSNLVSLGSIRVEHRF